jgi:hypothetical protein
MDYNWYNPALCNTAGTGQWKPNDPFTNIPTNVALSTLYFWSSTTLKCYPNHAWRAHMYHGGGDGGQKGYDGPHSVWPVRGGQ